MEIRADLHIHTALSPCAAPDMTPPAIVAAAVECGLAMIAVCDHNSAGNAAATQQAAGNLLAVIAGMEIMSSEEAHVVGLFPDAPSACAAGAEVAATLPDLKSRKQRPGRIEQRLMDSAGRVIGTEPKMLAAASRFTLSETVQLIHRHGGLAVAAHLNRPSFSVISQLGLFPEDAGFDAVEIFESPMFPPVPKPVTYGLPALRSSDSHDLVQIGSVWTALEMRRPVFDELILALRRTAV
ncbi:MAG: PHP domain-containing protein [Candidatus Brocadiia bacterium]